MLVKTLFLISLKKVKEELDVKLFGTLNAFEKLVKMKKKLKIENANLEKGFAEPFIMKYT